ncbi:hypothetical protein B0T16DRAFT_440419 [Cercophora newfieldiana]|uniref:4-coumarate--CoA ligase n=1 Tax=Cercophora newfieldiana TaxID=92897 RepID=A0AA39YM42_9PEZI|nr:hypothetical protein B0T16DRAFT_440419 [Cercophora newfieldiana]
MAVVTSRNSAEAHSGTAPSHFPLRNTFDWCFSQPFVAESDFIPAARRVPQIEDSRPIFVDNKTDRALTYGQIRRDAHAVASGLLGLGLDPNAIHKLPPTPTCPGGPEITPVVLIQLPNGLPIAPILLGTFASGLTATLVSPALTSDEIAWILQNARPKVIITATATLKAMRGALEKQQDAAYFSTVPIYTVDAEDQYPLPSAKKSTNPGTRDWKDFLESPPRPRVRFADKDAPTRTAVILWSSGTSGRSKGVLLSHHALNFSTGSLWHDADFYNGQPQRWLGYVPFYHVFGLQNVMLQAVCSGSTVYTMQAFSLDGMLAAIPQRRITYLQMAPPIAVMLAKAPNVEPYARRDAHGRNAFSSVVAAVTGGAPLGHEVVVEVYKRCGFRIRLGYGLSETCSTSLQRGCSEAEMHAAAGDTGRPHWGVELKVVPVDGSAEICALDVEGEILVRAPSIMTSYLPIGFLSGAKPDMSVTVEAVTPDGWFRTGDVGALNAAGHLRITDRLKELIKVRAYQVAPAELEAVLCSSEAVADAGVIGVYDESEATEWPRAFVVPRDTAKLKDSEALEVLGQELRGYMEERTAKYKWLVGGVVFVEQIPKSPSGKILRRVMKDKGVHTIQFVAISILAIAPRYLLQLRFWRRARLQNANQLGSHLTSPMASPPSDTDTPHPGDHHTSAYSSLIQTPAAGTVIVPSPGPRKTLGILSFWNPAWNAWVSLFTGAAFAVGHHAFYSSLDGLPSGGHPQMLRYGTLLAFLSKFFPDVVGDFGVSAAGADDDCGMSSCTTSKNYSPSGGGKKGAKGNK